MRIGVLGGTFDPVHLGHIKISKAVMDEMKLDKMLFIPSYVSPHKQETKPADSNDRLSMLRLSLKDEEELEIDEYELNKQEVSYSIDTIDYLRQKYEKDELFWIIGADMLFYIEKWHEFKRVLESIAFITVGRKGYEHKKMSEYISMLKKEYNTKIFHCGISNVDISSTDIRKKVKKGLPVSDMLHPDAERYIKNNGLYTK